ncbi:hypothetical protein K438DRAFT_722036 [Mycena galopus ATCC 62051]|nr:hypothetical protein K438DRAFT_722036 [Mycena galopus ATCC 62051]
MRRPAPCALSKPTSRQSLACVEATKHPSSPYNRSGRARLAPRASPLTSATPSALVLSARTRPPVPPIHSPSLLTCALVRARSGSPWLSAVARLRAPILDVHRLCGARHADGDCPLTRLALGGTRIRIRTRGRPPAAASLPTTRPPPTSPAQSCT